jgi:uridylate kinase
LRQMYLHLKLSGEILRNPDETALPWSPEALDNAAGNIAELMAEADEVSLEGLLVVTGAGNVIRGDKLRKNFAAAGRKDCTVTDNADVAGRLGTMMNGLMFSSALTDAGVPNRVLVAPNMAYQDRLFKGAQIQPYNSVTLKDAYENGLAVVAIGGTGQNDQTTDAAVLEYASMHAIAMEGTDAIAFKATKYNGVFTDDPATNPHAMPFVRIPAALMDRYYEQFPAVDRPSLRIMMQADAARMDVGLQVYANEFTPLQVLRARANGQIIGSLVTSAQLPPELHEEFPLPVAA